MPNPQTRTSPQAWIATAVALALILAATLSPQPEAAGGPAVLSLVARLFWVSGWKDVLQNVLLYVPLGFAPGRAVGVVAGWAFAVSGATEALQLAAIPGRDASAMDVVTNVVGACGGAAFGATAAGRRVREAIAAAWLRARRPDGAQAASQSLGWGLGVGAMALLTGWLLTPAPPPPYVYEVMNPFGSQDRLTGAMLDGRPLPFGPVRDPDALRAALVGPFTLTFDLRCAPTRLAPVLSVAGVWSLEALRIEISGDDLRLRTTAWATRLWLHTPPTEARGLLRACPSDGLMRLVLTGPPQRLRLSRDGGEVPLRRPSGLAPWGLVAHLELMPRWLATSLHAAGFVGLLLPFGFWLRASAVSAAGVLAVVGAVVAPTLVWGVAPPAPAEVLWLVAGCAVGVGLRRRAGGRSPA